MVELMKRMLKSYEAKIEAYEIEGSYCPGSYDLSIGGKKFAGISQRRLRAGLLSRFTFALIKAEANGLI